MRTLAKITLSCVSLLLILTGASSCGAKQDEVCEKRIAEEIYVGVPAQTADGALKSCRFKTTLDVAKKTLYADKWVGGPPVLERTQVLISLDSDKKVASVKVTKSLTGPQTIRSSHSVRTTNRSHSFSTKVGFATMMQRPVRWNAGYFYFPVPLPPLLLP
jgi:hypothetical protein